MAEPGVELLISARADAVVPVVTVGLGGIWTEALDDVAVVPLPADADAGRGGDPLAAGRGAARPADGAASRSTSTRRRSSPRGSGELLLERGLRLIELNPVVVHRPAAAWPSTRSPR